MVAERDGLLVAANNMVLALVGHATESYQLSRLEALKQAIAKAEGQEGEK